MSATNRAGHEDDELKALKAERDRLDARIRALEAGRPSPEADARVLGTLALIKEMTERQRQQAEQIATLKQADVLKEQFLGVISHELRTPLHVLLGYLSLLQNELAGPLSAQQHEALATMRQTTYVLTRLVSDLLDMSQIQAGAFSLDPQPLELMTLVAEVLEGIAPLATSKRLALHTALPAVQLAVLADHRRVGQVLLNLLSNAVKFTPEGGRVDLRIAVVDGGLRCEVTDTGPGIPPEDRPRLFQRFSQLDMKSTRRAGGAGLGLSIAKGIVEAHGGRIGVESEPGAGSTFWFTLPAIAPEEDKRTLSPG
jgi:signal transduction histidine kinase